MKVKLDARGIELKAIRRKLWADALDEIRVKEWRAGVPGMHEWIRLKEKRALIRAAMEGKASGYIPTSDDLRCAVKSLGAGTGLRIHDGVLLYVMALADYSRHIEFLKNQKAER